MTSSRPARLLHLAGKFFWILFLVLLPITSFPHFPMSLGGATLVRPLSIFPLLALLPLVILPRLFRQPIPRTARVLLPFALVAALSSALSLISGIDSNFGVSVPQRLLRAMATLLVGGSAYLAVILYPQNREDLRAALRWIYAGFGLALLWGSLQSVYIIHFSPEYFAWLNRLQALISTRRLFETRISGMTYEPNWFAEQIVFLLMPWLLAAISNNYTVFRWRWRRVTVEWFLFAWAGLILLFTFSRSGLLVLMAQFFVFLIISPLGRLNRWRSLRFSPPLRRLSFTAGGLTLAAGLLLVFGSLNTSVSHIWNYWLQTPEPNFRTYLYDLGFGPRLMYGETAYRIYESYPILGVGLGNYAFYFEEMLPDRYLGDTPEILRLLSQNVIRYRLMTPKNFYLRILAETGLVGFATFLAFVAAVFGCVLYLYTSPSEEERYWGSGGLFAMVAFVFSALSFDSFAIPNLWVAFGLITVAAWIFRRQTPQPQP